VVDFDEICDDGNAVDWDECSNQCVRARYIFVTTNEFNGNLEGIAGADVHCFQQKGDLPGEYYAWLAIERLAPVDRFDIYFEGWYIRTDGTPIAQGWVGLTTLPIENPINLDAGSNLVLGEAWTNVKPDGSAPTPSIACGDWSADFATGTVGELGATNASWTQSGLRECFTPAHLYCIEDPG